MIIRIPISELNSSMKFIYPEGDGPDDNSGGNNSSDQGGTEDNDDSGNNGGNTEFALPAARFLLSERVPDDYSYSRYAYPAAPVNVVVPDDDKPIVSSWLGNTSTSGMVASDTLTKRMTSAVLSAFNGLVTAASRMSLFTSPFRIGIALRCRDGRYAAVSDPVLITPNTMAPVMAIRESSPSADSLVTMTEIRMKCCRLTMALEAFELPSSLLAEAVAVDIYATRQTSLMAGDESVLSIRSYAIDGSSVPCWNYKRMDEDLIREKAERDTDYRIIGSIPAEDAVRGTALGLPRAITDLTEWNSLEKFDRNGGTTSGTGGSGSGDDSPTDPGTSEGTGAVGMIIRTDALDLGLPEQRKRIRGVTIRGIFPRRNQSGEEIRMTVYGAQHRDCWRKLAESTGPHIRFLRGLRYRWIKVEAEGPADALYDALVFDLA